MALNKETIGSVLSSVPLFKNIQKNTERLEQVSRIVSRNSNRIENTFNTIDKSLSQRDTSEISSSLKSGLDQVVRTVEDKDQKNQSMFSSITRGVGFIRDTLDDVNEQVWAVKKQAYMNQSSIGTFQNSLNRLSSTVQRQEYQEIENRREYDFKLTNLQQENIKQQTEIDQHRQAISDLVSAIQTAGSQSQSNSSMLGSYLVYQVGKLLLRNPWVLGTGAAILGLGALATIIDPSRIPEGERPETKTRGDIDRFTQQTSDAAAERPANIERNNQRRLKRTRAITGGYGPGGAGGGIDTTHGNYERQTRGGVNSTSVTGQGGSVGDLISSGEGGYGSYNRGVAGDSPGQMDFSQYSLVDLYSEQKKSNRKFFAAGKYQITPQAAKDAIKYYESIGVDPSTIMMGPEGQERVFREFLIGDKRKPIKDYITGRSDNLRKAQLSSAQEFASVGVPGSGRSYYAGSAGNKASISPEKMAGALNKERELFDKLVKSGMSEEDAWRALSDPNKIASALGENSSVASTSERKENLQQDATAEQTQRDQTKVIESYGKRRPGRPDEGIRNVAQSAATASGMEEITFTSGKGNWISPRGIAKGQRTTVHSTGKALDVAGFANEEQKKQFIREAYRRGAKGVGVYKDGSVHIDFGKDREWSWEGAPISKKELQKIKDEVREEIKSGKKVDDSKDNQTKINEQSVGETLKKAKHPLAPVDRKDLKEEPQAYKVSDKLTGSANRFGQSGRLDKELTEAAKKHGGKYDPATGTFTGLNPKQIQQINGGIVQGLSNVPSMLLPKELKGNQQFITPIPVTRKIPNKSQMENSHDSLPTTDEYYRGVHIPGENRKKLKKYADYAKTGDQPEKKSPNDPAHQEVAYYYNEKGIPVI